MREIDVIDVARQEDCKMLMRDFTQYYNSQHRQKVYNVISLEFSNTKWATASNYIVWFPFFFGSGFLDSRNWSRVTTHLVVVVVVLVGVRKGLQK